MFVLGTAGHVDHGKSTLVAALTGIDPDRLAEEKARGLTIDLGFAWMTLPSGREVGIIDVPGHERFIHNMLAGAGQIDATIFVVDANEGWRPQSEEHLAILELLGARGCVVALTKSDIARDADATAASVRARLDGTVFAGSPIVPISAVTGEGLDLLVAAIDSALDAAGDAPDIGRPRVHIDRSFSIKGAGTVVTGTLTGGSLREEDEVLILPSGISSRIRSIQTHQARRALAEPASRVALNLTGVSRDQVRRGDAVVKAGQWQPTTLIHVDLRAVRSLDHPVTAGGAYVLHAGTAEVPARLRLIDAKELPPGGSALARLMLAAPIVVAPGDRVVLRDTGRRQTVAGGRVLDAHPSSPAITTRTVAALQARRDATPEQIADLTVRERGAVRADALEPLSGRGIAPAATRLPSYFAAPEWLRWIEQRATAVLQRFHDQAPFDRGMPREALREELKISDARLFGETLDTMRAHITQEGPLVRLSAHTVALGADVDEIRNAMTANGFQPPIYKELVAQFDAARVRALIDAGELVRIGADVLLTAEQLDHARTVIAALFAAEGPLTAGRIKEALSTSRKYVIPLLEHLDAAGFTTRAGDVRTVGPPRPSSA